MLKGPSMKHNEASFDSFVVLIFKYLQQVGQTTVFARALD